MILLQKCEKWCKAAWRTARSYPSMCASSLCALVLIILSMTSGSYGLSSMLRSFSFVCIAALGQSIVMYTGGIDLSIQALYTLSGLCCTVLINQLGAPTFVAIAIGLAASATLGWLNGAIIAKYSLPPYLVTIGTLGVYTGICKILSAKYPILYLPADFTVLGQGRLMGIPIPFLICVLVLIVYQLLISKHILGRWLRVVGSNKSAAYACGIRVARVKRMAYLLCGLLVGLSGILEAARVGFSWQSTDFIQLMGVITAAVTGIYEIRDNRWRILGVMLGGLMIVGLKQYLSLFQPLAWEELFMGCAMLVILALGKRRHNSQEKGGV